MQGRLIQSRGAVQAIGRCAEVHMDKRFLDKFCPRFTGHMHYRLVDVSTVKVGEGWLQEFSLGLAAF